MNQVVRAYIGLGSNLDNPEQQVLTAIEDLRATVGNDDVKVSSLYRTKPMAGMDQPDYVNAVVQVVTTLAPEELLDECQRIESMHDRDRSTGRWSARTLDLDIILYGMETIATQRLTIPHYGMHERNFVLIPLAELDPDLLLPDNTTLQNALTKITTEGLVKIER